MCPAMRCEQPVIWTCGHSTRTLEEFVQLLGEAGIAQVADVRRYPSSRRLPQFQQAALAQGLARHGIGYVHLPDLGGMRHARLPDSPNGAWKEEAFNAYADHMRSPAFRQAFGELQTLATQGRVAVMCAEALPQGCHRRLLADLLLVRGWRVCHLLAPGRIEDHQLTPFACVQAGEVSYPLRTLF
jgi:uncharacterized protein (DUF488 family)